MKIQELLEWGRVVKGVNTTVDVDTNEIKTQAAKFGNTVDKDGRPPTMSSRVKGKSTNVLYNLGLTEMQIACIEGGHSLEDLNETTPVKKEPSELYKALLEAEGEIEITPQVLQKLEAYIDRLFRTLGMDIQFTRHFLDRVNDPRNIKPITLKELIRLFQETYRKWGKKIAQLGPDAEAVIKDMKTDINLPFVLVWDNRNQELDLIAKTIMRKKNFATPNQQFPIESFDTEGRWVKDFDDGDIQVFATKIEDAYIELTYKRMSNNDVYIAFSRGGRSSVTGEGNQNKIFGAVINHIVEHIRKLQPPRIIFSAFKPNTGAFGSQNTTRSNLYRKMVQRFASQSGYDYDVEDTGNEDTFILTKKNIEENFADGKVKGKSRPGRVKRAGASCKGSVTSLRKRAKNTSGERAKMYHWCANMKSGRKKK